MILSFIAEQPNVNHTLFKVYLNLLVKLTGLFFARMPQFRSLSASASPSFRYGIAFCEAEQTLFASFSGKRRIY
jgi:hypothetical protein